MGNVVFILGPGASKEAGVPLMAEFLEISKSLWDSGKVSGFEKDFERVFGAIDDLTAIHSKSALDIDNIESVFACFEMANTLKKFSGRNPKGLGGLVKSLKVVIAQTIEAQLQFPILGGTRSVHPDLDYPKPYESFVNLLDFLFKDAKPRRRCSIVTFNYDIAADFALYRKSIDLDYGLAKSRQTSGIPLLKLHGSLNWMPEDRWIVPVTMYDFLSGLERPSRFKHKEWVRLPITRELKSSNGELVEPIIVPPTWNKAAYHASLSSVWRHAAEELEEADEIFVIGYSLPPTDHFFPYLYALGTVGPKRLDRFWVFNPDKSVEHRFRDLLGPGVRPPRFKFFEETFSEAIDTIAKECS
jgi:hypothetical protein